MHPEGTRGKGDDPYTFLPAQPGVGKLALVGKPVVIPAFILGLGNNIVEDIRLNFTPRRAASTPVITVFGEPIDYADLLAEKPRPTLYKKTADRFMAEIKKLGGAREGAARRHRSPARSPTTTRAGSTIAAASKLYAREG